MTKLNKSETPWNPKGAPLDWGPLGFDFIRASKEAIRVCYLCDSATFKFHVFADMFYETDVGVAGTLEVGI